MRGTEHPTIVDNGCLPVICGLPPPRLTLSLNVGIVFTSKSFTMELDFRGTRQTIALDLALTDAIQIIRGLEERSTVRDLGQKRAPLGRD